MITGELCRQIHIRVRFITCMDGKENCSPCCFLFQSVFLSLLSELLLSVLFTLTLHLLFVDVLAHLPLVFHPLAELKIQRFSTFLLKVPHPISLLLLLP